MQVKELLDAIATGIEALSVSPLDSFEAYVGPVIGGLPAERVIVQLAENGGEENPRAISGGTGVFDETCNVEITAELHAEDNDTNRDKAYDCLQQIKKFCRDNRKISAGDDTARYAGWGQQQVGYDEEDSSDPEGRRRQPLRWASVVVAWKMPSDT